MHSSIRIDSDDDPETVSRLISGSSILIDPDYNPYKVSGLRSGLRLQVQDGRHNSKWLIYLMLKSSAILTHLGYKCNYFLKTIQISLPISKMTDKIQNGRTLKKQCIRG